MNKQNRIKLYAKALADIVSKEIAPGQEKQIIDNFLKLLAKTGQEKKSKEILDLTEDLLLAKQGKRKITFEAARKMTAGQKKMLKDFINKGDVVKEKINPEIIAGVKIIINGSQQFDASMQNKLRQLTTNV